MAEIIEEKKYSLTNLGNNNNKFWNVTLYDDGTVTSIWGRQGKNPQSKTWSGAGRSFMEQKIREKEKKGYRENLTVEGSGTVTAKTVANSNLKDIAKKQIKHNNPLISTPQRKALEKQVLRYRGQIKDKNIQHLVPPKEATEWMNICRDLDQNYRLDDLKDFARTANITLSIDGKPKTKRQLCVDLARQYTRLQQRTRHKSDCENDSDLTGDDFDSLDPHEYVRMPGGYCLSLADIAGLAPEFIDPFKRGKLPETVIKYYKENKHLIRDASGVHELKPVGEAYKHQETAMRLANILNSTERKVDGRVEVVPGETKYFDVGRLLVDKGTIDEYRRVIKRQKLIQDLQLEDYFRIGAPIVEYYDAMVDSLKRVKENHFNSLESLKLLYVEVMRSG